MRTATPNEDNLIFLGKEGENDAVQVVIDVSEILTAFGDGGSFVLTNMRSEDTLGYPVEVLMDGSSVIWTVQNADLAYAGEGKLEVTYYLGSIVAKTVTYQTYVCPSVTGGAEPPEPWKTVIDQILQARDEAVASASAASDSEYNASQSASDASLSAETAKDEADRAEELADQIEHSLDDVEALIPPQASPENQLADKAFVNSSVATNTANYISNNGQPFTSVAQLEAYSGTVTNNDYAFVTGTDAAGNTYYDRYKATVSGGVVTWAKEYRLNNSSFTAVQWAAIESGITGSLVASYSAHVADKDNPHEVAAAQIGAIEKVAEAVANDIAALTADGSVADSGISADYLVPIKAASGSEIEFTSDASVPIKSALIKGKTAAINQLLQNGDFADSSGWSTVNASFSVSGGTGSLLASAQSGQVGHTVYGGVAGHTYFVAIMLKTATATTQIQVNPTGMDSWYINTVASTGWQVIEGIKAATTSGNKSLTIIDRRQSGWDAIQVKNAVFIDLTLCGFTSEETADVATLKAAWLNKYGVPLPQYIQYNAGSIVNNNATYQLCGHNLWDEEWELGTISATTGENVSGSSNIRTKNYIPVKPNTTYFYCNGSAAGADLRFYDANKQYIGAPSSAQSANGTFTTPDNACYLRFACLSGYGTTYKNDTAINFPATVTTYEPHHDGGSITADSLNGIGTVADEQDATGHIDRRISEDDFSELSFTTRYTGSVNKTVSANLTDQYIGYPATEFLALAEKYAIQEMVGGAANLSDPDNKAVGVYWYGKSGATVDRVVYIVLPVADTPTGKIVYRKATPTTDTTAPGSLTTQKGYNLLRTVDGDIQSAPAGIEYLNGLAAELAEALQ